LRSRGGRSGGAEEKKRSERSCGIWEEESKGWRWPRIGSALELGDAWTDLQQEVARVAGQRRLQSREQSGARGRRERGFPKDLFVILENCKDLPVKKNLTIVLGLKQRCDQNENCTTFQTLQFLF
jgi:hypothetical protein